MSDLRIGGGSVFPAQVEIGETEERLGLAEEATSLPEWQGWDRIENSSRSEAIWQTGLDLNLETGPILDQLRTEEGYQNLADLDDKRFFMDVMSNISGKLDEIVDNNPSDRLLNLRETVNELLELVQTAYSQQVASIKG